MALTKVPSNLDAAVSITQSQSDNSTNVATTAYVDTAISNLSDSAPAALNTLNEIAAALGDDANYAATTTAAIAGKLPLAGGTMSGVLSIVTPSSTTSSLTLTETGGVTSLFKSTGSAGHIGSVSNHPFNIIQNNTPKIVLNTSGHVELSNDLQLNSINPRIDFDNNDSNGSLRLFSTSSNAATHQFYPNGHAHFITTAGTFKIEGLGSTSNQIESGGTLKIRSASGHVDLLDGTTEVLNTTTTGVTLPLNLVVNGKLGINENSLSSNARLQLRYDNSQSYSAYNALTNPSMIIKNLTSGASKFASLGFITEANGEGAISLVQGSGNINADMTFSVRSSGTRAEHMRITHDGKVGIGTTAPTTLTEIRGTVPTLTLSSSESKTWSSGDDIAKISFFSRDGSGIGAHETGFILNKTENSGASLSGVLVLQTIIQQQPRLCVLIMMATLVSEQMILHLLLFQVLLIRLV